MKQDRPLLLNEAVNFEKRAIFIAVPKTGSTSIRRQVRQKGPTMIPNPHLSILQVRDCLYPYFLKKALGRNRAFPSDPDATASDAELRAKAAGVFGGFFKFATVRNPWARALSLYKRREGLQMAAEMGFEDFCTRMRYASDTSVHPTRAEAQLDWITDETGAICVDYVLRLEDWDSGIAEINARTDGRLALEALHLNGNPDSTARSYRDVFSAKARADIAALFCRDIEAFGYEF